MPYSVPPTWAHGDEVTAAKLQKYSDSIAFLYAAYNGKNRHFAVTQLGNNSAQIYYFVVHRFKWLWFRGEGRMAIFGAPEIGADLSSGSAWVTKLDLDSFSSWLHYGNRYLITGVTFAFESYYT